MHEAVLAAHADDDLDMDPTLRACVQRSLVGPHLSPAADPVAPPPWTLSAFGRGAAWPMVSLAAVTVARR